MLTLGFSLYMSRVISGLMAKKKHGEGFRPPRDGFVSALSPVPHPIKNPQPEAGHFSFCPRRSGWIPESWFLGNLQTEEGPRNNGEWDRGMD